MEETIKIKNNAKSLDNLKKLGKNFIYFLKLALKSSPFAISIFLVVSIIASFFPAITSKVFGDLVDTLTTFITSHDASNVWYTLIIYAIIFIIPNILDIISNAAYNIFQNKFITFVDLFIARKKGAIDIALIEDSRFQDFMQQASSSGAVGPVIDLIGIGVTTIRRFSILAVSSVVLLSVDWRIFLLVVILSIPKLFNQIKYGGLAWKINSENSREQRIANYLKTFFVSKFSVIESKLYQIQNLFLDKISKIFTGFNLKRDRLEKEKATYELFSEIISTFGVIGGLSLAIISALNGDTTIGSVVFVFSIISTFDMHISGFLINLSRLLERNLYVTDILEIINTKPVIKEIKNPKKIASNITPEIEFKNVSFKYPGQNNYVLKNISFKINSGEKVGLVGHNGAGKTTIIRLLLRIHDASEGQILINGIDLKHLSLQDWWSKLAVLPQDFSSFNFSAKNSISYGDISKTLDIEKVMKAAKQSTASEFIEKWDDQYERMIGVEFGGAELSKGERQKMALARVFYRDSPIFILDEPTAAIDSKSTSEIFRNIEAIPDIQSMLIISHNFATLRRANKIIFIDNGEIVEQGSHDELMKAKKTYSELYDQQKGEYE